MRKLALLAAVAALALPGLARADADHTGLSLQVGANEVTGDVHYSGGKPTEALSGALATGRVGFDYQFGAHQGLVLGGSYSFTLGDGVNAATQRDGNYLVQGATLDGFSTWEGRVGYAIGDWMPYVGYGQMDRNMSVWQSCPDDWNAVPFGFCHAGGNSTLGVARQGQRSGNADRTADLWRVGMELNINEQAFVDLSWAKADFGRQIVALDPDPAVVPPTDPQQSVNVWTLQTGFRF